MDLYQALLAAAIGLVAGIIGGMAGIGGSMVMLPGLAIVFGFPDDPHHTGQHVYQAAAMSVNVLVAVPATVQHHRAGAVRRDLVLGLLPSMCVAMVVGVLTSNLVPGRLLSIALALFIGVYCLINLYRVMRPRPADAPEPAAPRGRMLAVVGCAAGLVGGVLGLGGGVVTVPLLQVFAQVRLRHAIAASSATMGLSALVGAALKLGTLGAVGRSVAEALLLAAAMGPMAVAGALMGATLAHRLPVRWVRLVVTVLLLMAAVRMAVTR